MRHILVDRYVSNDGVEWTKPEHAKDRDTEIEAMAPILALLPKIPDLKMGTCYQHKKEDVLLFKRLLIRLSKQTILKWWMENKSHKNKSEEEWMEIHPSWFERMLDGGRGPISDAWSRLHRIDEDGREWDQPYYAWYGGKGKGEQKPVNAE